MDTLQAKEQVVKAGKQLVESGLIVRTWGNVSCRISSTQFAITPSGLPYETLTPAEIVVVNIADASYEGNIKPSSEKGFHAAIYKQRNDVNFIVHTHQAAASALSPLQMDFEVKNSEAASIMGQKILCASYGLPGSKKLIKAITDAISSSDGKAFLMAYHGALCLGENYEEAFRVAAALEDECESIISRQYMQISGKEAADPDYIRDYFLALHTSAGNRDVGSIGDNSGPFAAKKNSPTPLYNSEKAGDHFKLYLNAHEEDPFPAGGDRSSINNGKNIIEVSLKPSPQEKNTANLPAAAFIHREIYRKNKNVRAIVHTTSPDILAVSCAGKKLHPLLDDFAQIIGTGAPTVANDLSLAGARKIARKFKRPSGLLIQNNGALCCGPTKSDAVAAKLAMGKNCKTRIATSLFKEPKPLNPLESLVMRIYYQVKYSREAQKK